MFCVILTHAHNVVFFAQANYSTAFGRNDWLPLKPCCETFYKFHCFNFAYLLTITLELLCRNCYKLHFKQLLDEVFVISRIIKVEERVISRSRRLRLITLTETLIILDITKTESNNCFIIH